MASHARTFGGTGKAAAAGVALLLVDGALAWGNLHATDDVQPVVGLLLIASFAFGFYRPRWSWLFALLLFAAIPASTIWAYATNYPVYGGHHPLYEELIALIPVAIGAAAGAGTRLAMRSPRG
ncbi:MAG TPA: hypothetical protein VIO84_08790 [Candidatus Dormibacteraeota bacterium]|jgi:hypothetical protein